ncbi:hypothetical protein SAMN04488025_1548 [Planifilum fulgidum]|uniref:Uncharacterized protein n=1 Tax=Planifilum fulgidum TaxID=201973 RepID=A0A1I2T2W9_9BACL|nr:hypothetical protein SAMN04488025_1548 [Planifilum fulgidum]
MKQGLLWMLILCLVFVSGCSLLSGKNADQTDEDKESDEVEVKQAATDVEGMLREARLTPITYTRIAQAPILDLCFQN